MNRRSFIKRGSLFVPMIFIPRLIRGQDVADTAEGIAAFKKPVVSGGGGGGGGSPYITSVSGGTTPNAFTGKLGMNFTPNIPITITDLGRYVVSGNSSSHIVRLWDAGVSPFTVCAAEIANCTVNTSGQTPGTYVYGSITPTSLLTTHRYLVVSDETSGGDHYLDDASTISHTSDATLNFSTYYDTSCHVNTAGKSYGVNWKYTNP